MYINDAIGFRMTPEVLLYHSRHAFGTADAVCFRKGILKISDLKTGKTQASMFQLIVYASLFCLEYGVKQDRIEIELRIYQNDDIAFLKPDPGIIEDTCTKITKFSQLLDSEDEKDE